LLLKDFLSLSSLHTKYSHAYDVLAIWSTDPAFKRQPEREPSNDFKENAPERPYIVWPRVKSFAQVATVRSICLCVLSSVFDIVQHLRSKVLWSTCLNVGRVLKGERWSKVYQLQVSDLISLKAEQDVVGLDVSMDNLEITKHLEDLGNSPDQISKEIFVSFQCLEVVLMLHVVDPLAFVELAFHVKQVLAQTVRAYFIHQPIVLEFINVIK
jgi:hypothetical protein